MGIEYGTVKANSTNAGLQGKVVIQITPQFLWDALSRLKDHLTSIDPAEYPDEIKFLDAGKLGMHGSIDSEHYSKCIASTKQDCSGDWTTFDDILQLVEWVAASKYNPVPTPPAEPRSDHVKFYRRRRVATEDILQQDNLPAQLRVSTPGTYIDENPRTYIYIRIDRKDAGEAQWTLDSKYGLRDVLEMLETQSYTMDKLDIDQPERVFRRRY